jgi:polyisoprenoid-binding protein YceI
MKKIVAGLVLVFAGLPAWANWTLDNDASRLSYVTTKANVAAEVNRFRQLSGEINEDGTATLVIALDSVDTAVEIRDQRMREILFDTAQFPTATISAKIDSDLLDSLAVGSMSVVVAEANLQLHGMEVSMIFEATVARLAEDSLLVTSTKPVIVNAAQVGLVDGIEKLRELAGLPSISPAVPVNFVLKWSR